MKREVLGFLGHSCFLEGYDISAIESNSGSTVCWLILCVSLTGLKDAQIAGKALLLDMSVRVFLKEISI